MIGAGAAKPDVEAGFPVSSWPGGRETPSDRGPSGATIHLSNSPPHAAVAGTPKENTVSKTTSFRRAAVAASVLCAATLLAGGTAAAAPAPSGDGVRISMAAAAECGLYRDGGAAMYRNCTAENQRILVTYLVSPSVYFCVPAGESRNVGSWDWTFRAYVRGTC